MTGIEELDAMIEQMRGLKDLAAAAAPGIAEAMQREAERTIAAGTTAYGEAWKLTKDEGKVPLRNAVQALKVASIGTRIYMRLIGPEARHHLGWGRGGVPRNVLPIDKIPAPMAAAITVVLKQRFAAMTGAQP